jgi:hypothetical protein
MHVIFFEKWEEYMSFKKAERKIVKLKIALQGGAGSGKTYSALLIAKGMHGKIAVIDTENGSASLYAGIPHMPEYDTNELSPPFSTSSYIHAIQEAVKLGYDILIIDSLSHQWAGEGGIIDRMDKEKVVRPTANTFSMWAKYSPEHEKFKQAILQAPIHIIATMRSKQEYALTQNEKGKNVPQKLGMAPVQRDQMDYEFTTVFDIDEDHLAKSSKDRTMLFLGEPFKITENDGEKLREWVNYGKVLDSPIEQSEKKTQTTSVPNPSVVFSWNPERLKSLKTLQTETKIPAEEITAFYKNVLHKEKLIDLNAEEYDRLWSFIKSYGQSLDELGEF